ncbi:hypothetical protein HMI54_000555, partial [Coelomomyces lativittatus]
MMSDQKQLASLRIGSHSFLQVQLKGRIHKDLFEALGKIFAFLDTLLKLPIPKWIDHAGKDENCSEKVYLTGLYKLGK